MPEEPQAGNIKKCAACSALVMWAANDVTKKPAPLDAEPSAKGNILYVSGVYTVLTKTNLENARRDGARLYTSHFATCPEGPAFRKKKGAGK
jgi:hypothetical protein